MKRDADTKQLPFNIIVQTILRECYKVGNLIEVNLIAFI
jgi:hypothetical protein